MFRIAICEDENVILVSVLMSVTLIILLLKKQLDDYLATLEQNLDSIDIAIRTDKIAEKYDGFVNRKNEPGIFATEVMLPL